MNNNFSKRSAVHLAGKGELRTLHLHISDLQTSRTKVILELPVGLVGVAQRMGARLLPSEHTIDDMLRMAHASGARFEWIDADNSERLELTLE